MDNKNLVDGGRVYFVIDMKCFFASVECAERNLDPFDTNLVVADESRGQGGVCLAITPKMKSLGIKNRCRLFEIPPQIQYIIAKPRMKKYIEYAANIYEIYLNYIDKNDIHVYSIDECIIDVTDYLKLYHTKAKDFANKLMTEINEKLHIPSTTGIGTNMYLAKIALDITAKHSADRIGWLTEKKYKETLWDYTPITDFWQISHGIANRLEKIGITTMHGIATCDEKILYNIFGVNAELLIDHSKGIEPCRIIDIKNYKSKSKSLGTSQILPRNYDFSESKIIILEMLQTECYELIKNNYMTNLIILSIGFDYSKSRKDSQRISIRLSKYTNLYSDMCDLVIKFYEKYIDKSSLIRRISIEFCNLIIDKIEQIDMFSSPEKNLKEKQLFKSIINIHEKFGKNSILKGIDLNQSATQKERNKLIGGHNSGEK